MAQVRPPPPRRPLLLSPPPASPARSSAQPPRPALRRLPRHPALPHPGGGAGSGMRAEGPGSAGQVDQGEAALLASRLWGGARPRQRAEFPGSRGGEDLNFPGGVGDGAGCLSLGGGGLGAQVGVETRKTAGARAGGFLSGCVDADSALRGG